MPVKCRHKTLHFTGLSSAGAATPQEFRGESFTAMTVSMEQTTGTVTSAEIEVSLDDGVNWGVYAGASGKYHAAIPAGTTLMLPEAFELMRVVLVGDETGVATVGVDLQRQLL